MSSVSTPTATVITIARNRRDHLQRQRAWLQEHAPTVEHVIVDMGGAPIGLDSRTFVVDLRVRRGECLPLAQARNLGAAAATGEVLIFLDVDCLPGADLVPRYTALVSTRGGVWSGPVGYLPPSDTITTWDPEFLMPLARFHDERPVPGSPPQRAPSTDMFWSLSFATTATAFGQSGGFDERFCGYGGEDTDFARQLVRSGIDLWFDGGPLAFHQHHPVSAPPIEHILEIADNARRFHAKWGDWPMTGWLRSFADLGLITWSPTSSHLVVNDVPSEREAT